MKKKELLRKIETLENQVYELSYLLEETNLKVDKLNDKLSKTIKHFHSLFDSTLTKTINLI